MTTVDGAAAEWLGRFVAETLVPDEVERLVALLDEWISEDVPWMRDAELQRELAASTRGHAHAFLASLTDPAAPVRPPEDAHALARTLARRGMELRALLELYHAGDRAVTRYLSELIQSSDAPTDVKVELLAVMWERANRWLNGSVEILAATYTDERESGLRGALSLRADLVRALLAGEIDEVPIASQQLGYPLGGPHVGFVLWSQVPSAGNAIGVLESLARQLVTGLGATRALVLPSGSQGVWAWAATSRAPDELTAVEVPDGLRVAAGAPGHGIAGFRRTHHEAQTAQRIATDRPPSRYADPRLTTYAEIEVAAVLGADPEGMRALVARRLAGLDGSDETSRRLRETLRTYLRHHRNQEATAQALRVHKNTVRYRIQQIEQLLGHPLDGDRLKLELALECLDTYGDALLTPDPG
ncbi:MAG: PucR family transcriptional regulator [Micromonosporaceae bacterium]